MILGGKECSIQLVEIEQISSEAPSGPVDVRIEVNLMVEEFSARTDSIRIEKSALFEFVSQLEKFSEPCQGYAKLESLIPDEFFLELRSMGSAGNFEVNAGLCLNRGYECSLDSSVSLVLESVQLLEVLDSFQSMLK